MEQPEDKSISQKPSTLIVVGSVIVIVLILVGLFLPPISLGTRLGLGGSAEEAEAVVESTPAAPEGIQVLTQIPLVAGSMTSLTPASFSASAEWAAAVASLPSNMTPASNIYTFQPEAGNISGQVALALSSASEGDGTLDLYGWNGSRWVFLPSQLDPSARQLVSGEVVLPQAVVIMQTAAARSPHVAAQVLPTQALPTEVLPLLTEVTAGSLTLSADGGLQGEATTVPTGAYDQLLRVTNTGAIVDQASLSVMLSDEALQTNQVNMLLGQMQAGNFAGINLDYQSVPAGQASAFTKFTSSLGNALHDQDHILAITLDVPNNVNGNWDSGGQDWAALGQLADAVYLKMPLDPAAYGDGGMADQLLAWATRQIPRDKIMMSLSASAIDRIGESFLELPNDQALTNFGELQFIQGGDEVEPGSPIEVALSGTASPLEWDGASLTYKYSYELSGQTHHVWLGSEAALAHQLRFADRYHLRGIAFRGLDDTTAAAGYADAINYYLGTAEAPQPLGAAIVWTVRTADGSVVASSSGDVLSFSWEGAQEPGSYSVNADFALGETVASLDTLQVAVIAQSETELVAEETVEATPANVEEAAASETTEPTEVEAEATSQPPPAVTPGDADAVVNVGANVRVGPGITYGTIAGGVQAGSKLSVTGRNADASWIQIVMPDGETVGWIYASLITINSAIDVSALEVVEVEPPVVAGTGNEGSSGGGGSNTAPPPVTAPPVTNRGFELGGQTHSFANPTLMSYAGMNWVKFQHKWSPGDGADAVAGRIQQAHANGFKVLLSIPGADHSSIDYGAYTSFLGGVAALGPDAIEVWNEMNIDREWPAGQIDPASYVNNMLAPAYNAIKSANSSVMVISGAPAPTGFFGGCGGGGCNDDLYMAGVAAAGGARYMDCIGIHYNEGIISPSQTSGDPRNPSNHYTRYFWGMVNTYWNAFGGSRPLCFTELGYLSGADYGGLPAGFTWAGNSSVSQHAQWLAEAASLSAGSGKVRLMIVFNVDFTTYGADPQAGYAMIRNDGSCPACETLHQVMGR